MDFQEFDKQRQFRAAWAAVAIARPVHFTLFTFGESQLPYYLVCGGPEGRNPVTVTRGEIRIERPVIITPDSARPELRDFFEDTEQEGMAQFLLARTARFSNLKLANRRGQARTVAGSVDQTVANLNQQLDAEHDDRVAILTAPPKLGGMAVLRYATEHVLRSSPGNIQELRERGFLP
ncbi:MAG: hypothetical protein A2W31_15575 [Planctomycetes bacterium RBG_16_64_10]|nr:MAG: hypothetical protein A2W31_15575 [Planctomycetes bacterium RBG_16_64_10]